MISMTLLFSKCIFIHGHIGGTCGLQKKGLLHKKFKGGKGFIREIVYNLIISEKLDPYLSFETKND